MTPLHRSLALLLLAALAWTPRQPAVAGRHASWGMPAWLLASDGTLVGDLVADERHRFVPAQQRSYHTHNGMLSVHKLA